MIEAAESISQLMADRERSAVESDRMLLFAVARALEIIGEAASQVSLETRTSAPEVR